MPLVLPFSALCAASLPEAGGKAANLGELTRAGFPVPPGFVVTTAAYHAAEAACGLGEVVERLAAVAPGDAAGLAAGAAEARQKLLAAPLDAGLRAAIAEALAAVPGPVAVRSSATAEDLPGASFAGQQDTYLHVEGPDAVADAVRRCWASLWSDRAVAYRAHQGVGQRHLALAVVVQAMVDSVVSGVAFTANPVTGKRGEAVIDASFGLGEAIVSGAVNPDRFVVDAGSGRIAERTPGDKRVAVRRAPDGGTRHEDLPDGSATPALTDAQVAEVAALGARVEAHYGAPQDLEFAYGPAGVLRLLQARPITTLYPLPPKTQPGLRAYFSVNVAQGVLQPFTPLGVQAARLFAGQVPGLAGMPLADPAQGPSIIREAGGRLFIDLTIVLRDRFGRAIMRRVLGQMEARSGATLVALGEQEPELALTSRPWWRSLAFLAGAAHRIGLPQGALKALIDPAAALARAEAVPATIRAMRELPATATPLERLDAFEQRVPVAIALLFRDVAPAALGGFAASLLLKGVLGSDATEAELQVTRRALPHNPTTEMNQDLADVAARPEALPAFLDKWGDRGLPEIDMGVPRWRDDPSFLVGALKNLATSGDTVAATFARSAAEAEAMVEALAARAGWRAPLVRWLAGRMRGLFGLREAPKFNFVTMLATGRVLLAPVGAALAEAGRLAEPGDYVWVDLAELRAGLGGADLRARVAERQAGYALELRRKLVPRVLLSDGRMPEDPRGPAPAGALLGAPASPGQVRAKARVVLDPVGAHLEPGEVLVAPSTDPGWTPLFLVAGGLVMEMGGAMSHGSVVAREFGIPAVVGVAGATGRIKTGDEVLVDGTAGTIVIG